uniref:Uncharacterized protein n=1 Tax=Brassica oleracea TaxID=3712 RepID=A0A3P6DCB1_BRAOL|nr:unnamed protein product [Brassica oleracea]
MVKRRRRSGDRTANVAGEYTCRTSAVEVEGIVNHVESDECVATCGVDRKTVESSDCIASKEKTQFC